MEFASIWPLPEASAFSFLLPAAHQGGRMSIGTWGLWEVEVAGWSGFFCFSVLFCVLLDCVLLNQSRLSDLYGVFCGGWAGPGGRRLTTLFSLYFYLLHYTFYSVGSISRCSCSIIMTGLTLLKIYLSCFKTYKTLLW